MRKPKAGVTTLMPKQAIDPGPLLKLMSDDESRRFRTAQREYSDSMEFDEASKLDATQQAAVLSLLANFAGKKPTLMSAPVIDLHTKKPMMEKDPETGCLPADDDKMRRDHERLLEDKHALKIAFSLGLDRVTIEHFKLGLSSLTYVKNVLSGPVRHRNGVWQKKFVNAVLPGLTEDLRPNPESVWSWGDPLVHYSTKQESTHTRLFICNTVLEMMVMWRAIQKTPLADELLLCAITRPGEVPVALKSPEWWERWGTIYFGHPKNADERAHSLARRAMRQTHRVWPVGSSDWTTFFRNNRVEDFQRLLENAHAITIDQLDETAAPAGSEPWFKAEPVDVLGGYHNGHLYEVIQVGEVVPDPDDPKNTLQRLRTWVIKSDGSKHKAVPWKAPPGTPGEDVIYRLWPDSSVVAGPPKARTVNSWRIEAIQKFLRGERDYAPMSHQLERIRGHLKASVWLPFDDDYTLLACTVVVTYVQSMFEAVPLLLATGGAGTGKTQLGIAMTELCANSPGTPVGQISAASIARLIDQTRGFVALDDLESVGARRGGDAQFDDLVQALKLSYKKSSATKYWTNMKTGRLEKLNFFGVKLIGNTRGVDDILRSRMFTISTRVMPKGVKIDTSGRLSSDQIAALRDELHIWAFSNVDAIREAYETIHPNQSTRSEEISAPLRVIAHLADDADLKASLEAALTRQANLGKEPDSPGEILRDALAQIVREHATEHGELRAVVTVDEVIMRMALMVEPHYGKEFTNEVSCIQNSQWVGTQLRHFYATGETLTRSEHFGRWLRPYKLTSEFVDGVLEKAAIDRSSLTVNESTIGFCRGCADCPYRARECSLRPGRLRWETDPKQNQKGLSLKKPVR